MEEQLHLTREWDKTFPQNSSVEHRKVTFHNRYGITLAADLYRPKGARALCPPWPSAGPSAPSRNRPPAFTPRKWPAAVHTDLYDRMDIIPFDKMESFFRQYLV